MYDSIVSWWGGIDPVWQSVILVAASVLIFLAFRFFVSPLLKRLADSTENDLDDRLVFFFQRFFGLSLLFLLVLGILKVFDIAVTPLLASAGIVGIALGLAAKETLADILAGIFLITDRPMRIGDRIKIEHIGQHWGSWGDVVDIGLRRTKIRNTDGVVVNYPNAVLANSVITNFSDEKKPIRVRVRFQVGYEADIDRVRELTLNAIHASEGVLEDTGEVLVRSLWDDNRGHLLAGVLVEGRYRIADVRDRTKIRSRVLETILREFRQENVSLAAPKVVVVQESDY